MGQPTSAIRLAIVAASLLVASGCGGDTEAPKGSVQVVGPSMTTPGSTTGNQAADAGTGTVVTTGPSEFGTMLFNDRQQAIYMFELETSAEPVCYDDCAVAWPPVLTTGEPVGGGSVDTALLGTTKRKDGSTQVTYNDHPLYYYVNEGPGEVLCHNVDSYGGLWWVLQPDGDRAP